MTAEHVALHANRVCMGYGPVDVVRDAEISLEPGAVVGLVGPNGSGKSTLLRGLSRLQGIREGEMLVDGGRDALAITSREFARMVAMLAQSRPVPSGVTVRDVVEFGRHPHRRGWRGRDEDGARFVDYALELTGMTPLAGALVDSLSGGQLQRAWFASALAQDTGVLLLDEPTNHLDLRYQVETLELMRSLADDHGVAVGVVLHDLDQAAAISDRLVVLSRGRVVASGDPSEVLTSALLSDVYEIDIEVEHGADGRAPRIHAPRMRLRRSTAAARAAAHKEEA
ncbi:ABC transporter ATP-binding protein [Microbacterium suaedae]|uniref:ABC transporter ATP-binding protein n=1 Tax=Microbacterium suaedae TaxID=2067813 RepID=UPI000DA233BD|nr:ABC transporter ATP-binding protein [Microbacterium suaedae]